MNKLFNLNKIVLFMLVLFLGLMGGLAIWFNYPIGMIDHNKYQAVFLTNGQVYFGKLSNIYSEFPVLTDVYYLIITKPIQGQENTQAAATETEFSLKKLGSEVHGPEDKMIINQKHILFFEDLKDSSKVIDTINQLKSNQVSGNGSAVTTP